MPLPPLFCWELIYARTSSRSRIEMIAFRERYKSLFDKVAFVVRMLMRKKPLRSEGGAKPPGLVLLQIDGLSRNQLHAALRNGRMPCISRLVDNEEYSMQSLYSGLPSSTPSVQGELFYGRKGLVPAFGYRNSQSGKIVSLFNFAEAHRKEREACGSSPHLLENGSSYSNIFTGGAKRSAFCFSKPGGSFRFTPFSLTPTVAVQVISYVLDTVFLIARVAVLVGIEILLALIDFMRGVLTHHNFWKEMSFIPARIGVCIVLRELVVKAVIRDIHRGSPIIHANFLGYDEQAHRRGPSSRFAHWTLQGIDDVIHRIWDRTQTVSRRNYRLIIYSDHGQEPTVPFDSINRMTLDAAVERACAQHGIIVDKLITRNFSMQLRRALLMRRKIPFFPDPQKREEGAHIPPDSRKRAETLGIAALGPVAHVYLPEATDFAAKLAVAQTLAVDYHAPAILLRDRRKRIIAVTAGGLLQMPDQVTQLVGDNHPFVNRVGKDILDMVTHREAGDLVLFGWKAGVDKPVTYSIENGSHAGFAPDETHAFCLSSPGIKLPAVDAIRPFDMRKSIMGYFSPLPKRIIRRAGACGSKQVAGVARSDTLRIMTYNVHSCIGLDRRVAPERIAAVIEHYQPHIVALQELDANREQTGWVDQARDIAKKVSMHHHFHPSYGLVEEAQFGNAVMSILPVTCVKKGALPRERTAEPRGVLWVKVETSLGFVNVFTTHFGLTRRERRKQVESLVGDEWLKQVSAGEPTIVCGDFNATPESVVYRKMHARYASAMNAPGHKRITRSWLGVMHLDHLFYSGVLKVAHVMVPHNHLTRRASDHYPVIVDLVQAR
ncbi:MAG: hypothetical protein GF398_18950 [Chitinivibrionales bacterium]|nr:hypothetical protein [Chitinivibrionales bacterium]